MARTVSGASVAQAGAAQEARDRTSTRGPLRVSTTPASTRERIRTIIVDDHEHIARLVANRIANLIREKQMAGEPAVLGLATGSTPIGVYRELIRMHHDERLSFRNVVTFNLDEYYPMSADSIHSYHRYMWENLFSQIDIDPANVHIPRGDVPREEVDVYCHRYEETINRLGGIDYQILGIGKTGRPTSSGRKTSRARRSRWASRRSSRRARSPSSRPASTSRRSFCAPWRASRAPTSPRRSCKSTPTPRSTS